MTNDDRPGSESRIDRFGSAGLRREERLNAQREAPGAIPIVLRRVRPQADEPGKEAQKRV